MNPMNLLYCRARTYGYDFFPTIAIRARQIGASFGFISERLQATLQRSNES